MSYATRLARALTAAGLDATTGDTGGGCRAVCVRLDSVEDAFLITNGDADLPDATWCAVVDRRDDGDTLLWDGPADLPDVVSLLRAASGR